MNTLKTFVYMGILSALIIAVGSVIGGKSGMILAFVFALGSNIFAYWFSAPMALAMSGAQPIAREQAPRLYQIVEGLAAEAKIPVPSVYFIPTSSPNAFATGRDPAHSSIAVTDGIMKLLDERELQAVLAHELGHVRNHDILISSMAAVLAGVVTSIAHWGMYMGAGYDERDRPNPIFVLVLAIAAPVAASLINLAISRSREYEADATGARMCHDPLALASALGKIEAAAEQVPMRSANPALSSLYIVKPERGNWMIDLMSTHPPIADRIRRLQAMSQEHNH